MAAAAVDVGYLAGHLGIDQPILTSLTSEPTVDLVAILLQAITNKAHEFDTLYAEKLQTDIELENAVRSAESRSQASKTTADQALKDVQQARQKVQEEETKRQAVENELQVLKSRSSDHDADVKALNDKIETLQSSNRANLAIIEASNKRDSTLTEELTNQHQRNVELSREITSLHQSEQNARGQLSSAKYREESLQQQLDHSHRTTEWLENELKTKSEEALKYRKEKGARIAELQRQGEDALSQVESLKRSEKQLRDRLTTLQTKVDDTLVRIQKQEESFAATVDSYKSELEDQRRLVDMSEQLSQKHQDRVRELDAEKERLKDNYENELRRVRTELEQEKQVGADLETRIRQLEGELDEAQVRLEHAPPPGSAPQTPRANGGAFARAVSPFATPGSVRNKTTITATQAIDQLFQAKGQLASERRRTLQLTEELDGMIAALEAKAPEIQELQSESEMLRNELARMSELSQQSFEERDAARKGARKAEGLLNNSQSENKILRSQLRDLGTQIQMLVFNAYALEKGVGQLSDDEVFRLKQLEKGEVTEEALADMSDTHQFITQKLVVFKDIQSLQVKNQELLRITRELAEQIESEEALAAKHQAKEDHDKVEKLEQELIHMTEESKSIKTTLESYKAERDMFRRLLQQRTSGGDEASMMRSSLDGRLPLASIESGEQTEALSEALRKLQAEYDSFREAQDGVRKDLRNQVDALSAERNNLQTERIKLQGEARLESERREMLQGNYAALQTENQELQKRSRVLSETAAKQDIRTQQVAEELIDAKGLLDSVRNEAANLKAEKKLWKDIQDRMSKDNELLIEEKNRLGNLLATQQSLENERNISESESRRKAQAKIEQQEQELSDAHRKLSQAAEDSKNLQQRKEYEAREAQKRIDELMTSLGQIREEHIGVKTTKDHLQARVNELTVELRNAEERAGRLAPRPTPRPGAAESSEYQQELEAQAQSLTNDVAELRRDLALANTQLENAKTQAEQYRELCQSNEDALEDLRASQDQYRIEMESLIAEKEAKVKELGQRVDDMSSELSRSNSELSSLRDAQGEVARKYEDEKAILDEEISRLKEDSARHLEAARFHQQDLRAQAEIATRAQQDYEQELVKHADAAKLVQQLRNDYNELKSEAATLRAEADSAKVTLAQSESSWDDRRLQLEQEMTELKSRREDVNAQNKLLHQQLEGLTTQVNTLQQSRGGNGQEDDAVVAGATDAMEGLRELNSYLRREKEILEVQYDLKTQESKRLHQQVEYIQSQLDETRLKLDQERSQATQGDRSSMTHQSLMEKLNELNLYRESSMALRSENTHLKDQISERNNKIQELEAKTQPLESTIDNLNTQKSFLEDEIKQIQEDRDRWQKRTEGILTKYGRVDPAEMEQLKKTIADLQTECNSLKEGSEPLKAKVTELEAALEAERVNWQTTRSKIAEQFKERSKRISGEKNDAVQRAKTLQEELSAVTADLEAAKQQTEDGKIQQTALEKQLEESRQQLEQLRQQSQADGRQGGTASAEVGGDASASAEVVAKLEKSVASVQKELDSVNVQKASAEQKLGELRSELQTAVSERDAARQKLEQGAEATGNSVKPAPTATGLPDEEREMLQAKITAAEAKASEHEAKANEIEATMQQTIRERSDRMKDTLNNKLKDFRSKLEAEFKKKDEDLQLRFEQEKLIWQAENSKSPGDSKAGGEPPATPAKAGTSSVPATPGTSDLAQLDDAGIRQFLSNNVTAKNIISSNIRKRVETENAKLKSEFESKMKAEVDAKIAAAREQAQLMESKKSTLRINMTENKLRAANAKIGVVEAAANETPQKPVVEVWEIAKSTQPPPAPAANNATPKGTSTPVKPTIPAKPTATSSTPATPTGSASAPAANPFAASTTSNAAATVPANPFAVKTQGDKGPAAAPVATPATAGTTAPSSIPQPQQNQAPRGSAIPMLRGGGRGRGGPYVHPGQRHASGNQDGGLQTGAGRGGRGGARGGRGNLNPGASDFQPGAKRPRGDSEAGAGAKRARGGGPH
ncbi:Tetratricopeptide, MLP1/MLP2-like protein [Cordyceps fumosorosea ARSEF 2679]|uniref:Tetratricopeptide, MLP1/MLP2-like protein n=1 Tax=Cordyceps fumosorosea (strain ARSEF 2679) TaxID=1081104 RepID=A0A168B5J6_CORFA|nr:Tetratricopeptide, MLP1/MLP2-like protein [Cordyceps fumosorosea ARSEF 2679]OAA69648.1 Tetratricopeptide, MLP1/MLP2-like protein [Cordyceps fumosorosea ARSEF 2679]